MQNQFPSTILYGADYNPEQWPDSVWLEDMRPMKRAHVNMVTINVFAWALPEPASVDRSERRGQVEIAERDALILLEK